MKSNPTTKLEPHNADLTFPELDLEKIYWDSEKQIKEGNFKVLDEAYFDNWINRLTDKYGNK